MVRPNRDQLVEPAKLADALDLRPLIDRVFSLAETRQPFERTLSPGRIGKTVIDVAGSGE